MFAFIVLIFWKVRVEKAFFFSMSGCEQGRFFHAFSFRKWNNLKSQNLSDTCFFWRYQNKRQSQDTFYSAKEGHYSSIWCVEVPSLRARPLFTKVSGKSVVYTLIWIFSQLSWVHRGWRRVEERVKRLSFFCFWCRNYVVWLFSRINASKQDRFPTWFSIWFWVWFLNKLCRFLKFLFII